MRLALQVAAMLAVDRGVPGAVLLPEIRIDWQDGLPQDLTEAIQQESTAITAGLTSRRSAVQRLWQLDGQELEEELERIEEEQAALAPPVMPFLSGGETGAGSGDNGAGAE